MSHGHPRPHQRCRGRCQRREAPWPGPHLPGPAPSPGGTRATVLTQHSHVSKRQAGDLHAGIPSQRDPNRKPFQCSPINAPREGNCPMSPDLTLIPGCNAGVQSTYLGWLLSPGTKSTLLCPGQPWSCPEGLGWGVDHSSQREAQVGGTAHVGPGKREPCGGLCSVQDTLTLRLLPLQPRLRGTEEEETTVECPSQRCLPAQHERMQNQALEKSVPFPYRGPANALTESLTVSLNHRIS